MSFAQLNTITEDVLTVKPGHIVEFPPENGVVKIEEELISYSTYYSNSFYGCVREYLGTKRGEYGLGTPVYLETENIPKVDYNKAFFGCDLVLDSYSLVYSNGDLVSTCGVDEFRQYILLLGANAMTEVFESGEETTAAIVEKTFGDYLAADTRIQQYTVTARRAEPNEIANISFQRFGESGVYIMSPVEGGKTTLIVEIEVKVPYVDQSLTYTFGVVGRTRL